MTLALVNGRLLRDSGWVEDQVVLIEGARIEQIVSSDSQWRADATYDLRGQTLLPGFIDVQVNGGGGVLFNDDPSVASIREIGRAHRRFGTTGFLPTLISDDLDVVSRAVKAAQDAIEAGVPGVLGIHIEGPFLNEARKGVHDETKLRWLNEDALGLLTSLKGGKTLVTLAPERTTPQIIRKLADAGVIVSAGHTNGTYDEIRTALDHGLTGFTHLFNAMSQLSGREPGAVGAALDDANSWCGIIVDGHHVDPVVLKIAMRSKRRDRFMLVTDAMPTVGAPNKTFSLQGRPISVAYDNMLVDENGRLAGSDIDMATAVRNSLEMLDVDLPHAARMASLYPATFLGLDRELGRIEPGYRADLVLVDAGLNVLESWIAGQAAH
ncbi:N-acetylglucosamine-6-phosphate deacetylase [Steroidobacter agaridevorans]|uniref:N-acetylglucosamine-6-phosphate deacetylase n=1 Tax=Steroidobacter agaridevorans TaxID=2695856 RepID=A0A829YEE8_9GAMM|nr:N-acetylglucosamine-6-phosphate deacetylase [Steroidobacter agaridevorans]GFE81647.1 N-acetylglucosamine-6-phosphate deacetylase [Steroidobacter agaridevorans]